MIKVKLIPLILVVLTLGQLTRGQDVSARVGNTIDPSRISASNLEGHKLDFSPILQTKTEIRNAAAAKMLLGRHKLSLQWISWDYFGAATVTNKGGVYYLKGEQKGRKDGDFVKVDGEITAIDAKEFTLRGTVISQISHINGGRPCKREGDLTFRITGNRKYWRMQQIDNPCDTAADYVDVYFK